MNTDPGRVWRNAEPRCGVAWVRCPDLGPPVGWRVEVSGISDGGMTAHVAGVGIGRRAYVSKLDFGIELQTRGGVWIRDSDWRARRWLWRVRQALQYGRVPDGAVGLTIPRIDEVLLRYQK